MEKDKVYEEKLIEALKLVAPGTQLRMGLDNILRAKTGALIVLGDSKKLMKIVDGGFFINCKFTPTNIYELAKMDGAIILSHDGSTIMYANTHLISGLSVPSSETGIRHRTAERIAKHTGELVIAISQRRNIITIYKDFIKYSLGDMGMILTKANQAIQTLEKYKIVLDKELANLNALEYDDVVTVFDVGRVIQKAEMVMRIVTEIEKYITELGEEGRLIRMQLDELINNIEKEILEITWDYNRWGKERNPEDIIQALRSSEEILDIPNIARELGFTVNLNNTDLPANPKGYRLLNKIPRIPYQVIENLTNTFGSFQEILDASLPELDAVEGIGEVRARNIKEGLRRVREQIFSDRF